MIARKSDPVSKRTFTGFSFEPTKIVPVYPAPSSFVRSTLKPYPLLDGLNVSPPSEPELRAS